MSEEKADAILKALEALIDRLDRVLAIFEFHQDPRHKTDLYRPR